MIKFTQTKLFCFLLLIIMGVIVAGCSDDDCPNCPDKPVPKDYAIFFSCNYSSDSMVSNPIFRFKLASEKLDTFSLGPDEYEDIAVSAYGDRLYTGGWGINCRVYDTDSLSLITTLPYKGTPVVSPDNKYLAIVLKGVRILRISDYSLIYVDTSGNLQTGYFTPDGKSFFCTNARTFPYSVYELELCNFSVHSRQFSGGSVYRVIPSRDKKKLFLYRIWSQFGFTFDVYDIEKDSIIFSYNVSPGYGDLTLTPDGKHLFITYPGPPLGIGPPSPSNFLVYHIDENMMEVVDTRGVPADTICYYSDKMPIDLIVIPPDGKYVLATGLDRADFVLYDLATMKLTNKFFYFGCDFDFGYTADCQKRK
jgi:WD40 repeat protein